MQESDLIVENPPEGFKKLELVKGMRRIAPKINWGDEYLKWGYKKKIRYLEGLASTMNHAADILQKERTELMKIFKHQEAQIISVQKRYEEQTDLLNHQLTSFNTQKQELLQRVQNLERENSKLRKEIKCNGD